MRVPRRLVLRPFSYFHMMWRAHNREFIMQDHKEKLRYLRCMLDDYRKNCNPEQFEFNGYTLMSNHAHLNGSVGENHVPFSDHMRRAHSRFGMSYNKRHKRIGKVAHDRPKIKASQNEAYSIKVMLYDFFNPVRVNLVPTPTHVKWRQFSSARYLAFGEKNQFTEMLTLPAWYLRLGKTPSRRQRKFRRMLDEFAVEKGYKRDPKMARGNFVGGDLWLEAMKRRVRDWMRQRGKMTGGTGPDPPDDS